MIALLGELCLIVALCAAFFQAVIPFFPTFMKRIKPLAFLRFTTTTLAGALTFAFVLLIYAFALSDFSLQLVFLHSHTMKPLIYKISGTWGNHEGSMLLFLWILSLLSLLCTITYRKGKALLLTTMAVQGFIIFGFLTFVLLTSNPFATLSPVPYNGQGLNPLLQDIGLALHPPMLYVGYVGFSLAFSFAIAGLLTGSITRSWVAAVKPWILLSLAFLTLGIGLGSWWAYRELGWGGFWFWDPVENASLLPWLSGVALLHSLLVLEKRNTLKRWTVLLAILTFALSLLGFFLVRSGILTSVHAFAHDPHRGIFLLLLFALYVGTALAIFTCHAHKLASPAPLTLISREGSLLLNNVLLITLCLTVLLGTTYPIFLEVFTEKRVSVGTPYFNYTFNPIAIFLLLIAAIGPALHWKKDAFLRLWPQARMPILVFVFFALITWQFQDMRITLSTFALPMATALLWITLAPLCSRIQLFTTPLYKSWRKLHALPRSFLAMTIAHAGLALLALAITIAVTWPQTVERSAKLNETIEMGGYSLTFNTARFTTGKNYISQRGEFFLKRGTTTLPTLYPETRAFPVEGTSTTEAAIHTSWRDDLYLVIGQRTGEDQYAIKLFLKPAMPWVWIGTLLLTAGLFLATVAAFRKR